MFFIPLSQVESVDLVIHALRIAAGEADCTTCPARRVCMKQCLTIADSVSRMVDSGTLPCSFSEEEEGPEVEESPAAEPAPATATASEVAPAVEAEKKVAARGHLKIVK